MNPKLILSLFLVMAAAQVSVPINQVMRYEDVLRRGTAFKFRTAPVDPYDAFRGRYVALNFDRTEVTTRKGQTFSYGKTAYVTLTTNVDGFARFAELSATPPSTGDWLRVEYTWGTSSNAHFRLPFDRYYMEENAAPRAEEAYRQLNRRGRTNEAAYAMVRVKNGRGVIQDLYIAGEPIRAYLAQHPTNRP